MTAPRPDQLARWLVATVLSGVWAANVWGLWFSIDAAWVDARYARNLARGLGPVFNPTDAPLEGYMSPLGVAVGAVVELAGLPSMVVLQGLGALGGAALIALCWVCLSRAQVPEWIAAGACLSLAVSPMLGAWASGLPATLPGAFAIALLFAALIGAGGRRELLAVVAITAVIVLLRHDGALWAFALAAAVGGWKALELRRLDAPLPRDARRSLAAELRGPGLAVVTALGALGALTGLRLLVFGDPIPWVVRLGWPPDLQGGLTYLVAAGIAVGLPVVWLGVALFPGARDRIGGPSAGLLAVAGLGIVLSGGESEPFARLFVPASFFGTVCLGMLAAHQHRAGRSGTAIALLVGAVVLASLPALDVPLAPRRLRQATDLRPDTARTRTEIAQWRFTRAATAEGLELGRAVRAAVGPQASWTTGTPGTRGYASDLHLYDLSGRTSPLAHRSRTGARAPRAIFEPLKPTVLRARLIDDSKLADVLALDWAAADPATSARVLPHGSGHWLVLQERVP